MNTVRIICLLFLAFASTPAAAQYAFTTLLKDSISGEPLSGVSVRIKGTPIGAISRPDGKATVNRIPAGVHRFVFSSIGYQKTEREFTFPMPATEPVTIYLAAEDTESEEVVVEGTRSNKSIADIPTRVEALTEEIDEASTMDPSKIAHLITHSTGIQVQQTSAASNTANVRIQGMDGRYTQILKDGFPLYGGFSGSLSIMQIPPLDLRQVEYIKGGASTLYGGGAISGLINLISKDPAAEETLLHLNASHIGAFDVNAFVSRNSGNIGFTLLGQRNVHRYFDADGDGYSDMPQLTKYNLNPKLFFIFGEQTKLGIGATLTDETRQGGDIRLMNNEAPDSSHFFKEANDVQRITTQVKFDHAFSDESRLTVRNSIMVFDRMLHIVPSNQLAEYRFSGRQTSTFSEVTQTFASAATGLIAGLNFYTDDFAEDSLQSETPLRNEEYRTAGAFANFTADVSDMLALEAGFRADYVLGGKVFLLPRISTLLKWTPELTTRIGGGLGYRNPTVFNQEAEVRGFRNVLPVVQSALDAEKSFGANADIGYKTAFGEHFFITFNQMLFLTKLENPLILAANPNGRDFSYENAGGHTLSFGGETFFKFGFYDAVLFVGYTYTNATNRFGGRVADLTLTPRHSIKGDLLYSIPGKWRLAVDYEFKSAQLLSNGFVTPSYWTFGAVVEYTWEHYTFFGNVENFGDVRQTSYGPLLSPPFNTPQFTEVWAPLDGFVFNAGVKIRL